jgi:tetratricopeptide (TPR) repeat protein
MQLVAAIAAVLAFATPLAAQDDARARTLFLEGRDAYERADYRVAIARFERSFALSGRPTLMRNVARAWRRLGDTERARAALERYIALAPAGPERRSAEQELAELGRPSPVRRETPAAAAIVAVRAPAPRVTARVDTQPHAPTTRATDAPLAPTPPPSVPVVPSLTEPASEPADEPGFFEGRVWTFVAGTTAGVSGLVGGALYLDAYGRYEALAETCGAMRNCSDDAISSVETSLLAAEIAFGVAATALVGAIVLYFVEAP